MSEQHTQGFLIEHEESGVLGQDKILITTEGRLENHVVEIAEISCGYDEPFDKEQKANARRLIACWNACFGTGTEWLIGYGMALEKRQGTGIAQSFREHLDGVRADRKELIEALKEATETLEHCRYSEMPIAKKCRALLERLGE